LEEKEKVKGDKRESLKATGGVKGMSSGSAMVAAANTSGNGSLPMYDTSCSYQTALELKRMSSAGMTGVTPMTSPSVGMGCSKTTFLTFFLNSIENLCFLYSSFIL